MVWVRESVAGMVNVGVCFGVGRSLGVKVMVMSVLKVAGMVWSSSGLWKRVPESKVVPDESVRVAVSVSGVKSWSHGGCGMGGHICFCTLRQGMDCSLRERTGEGWHVHIAGADPRATGLRAGVLHSDCSNLTLARAVTHLVDVGHGYCSG